MPSIWSIITALLHIHRLIYPNILHDFFFKKKCILILEEAKINVSRSRHFLLFEKYISCQAWRTIAVTMQRCITDTCNSVWRCRNRGGWCRGCVHYRILSIYHLHAVYLTTAIQKTISLSERREILTTAICQHDRAFISEPEPTWEPSTIKPLSSRCYQEHKPCRFILSHNHSIELIFSNLIQILS